MIIILDVGLIFIGLGIAMLVAAAVIAWFTGV
jgi:hypothetical protein